MWTLVLLLSFAYDKLVQERIIRVSASAQQVYRMLQQDRHCPLLFPL